MVGGKRVAGEELSDFYATYGVATGKLDYDTFVALYLNIPRQRDRNGMLVADAVAVANDTKQAPAEWYAAVAETDADADERRAADRTAALIRLARR